MRKNKFSLYIIPIILLIWLIVFFVIPSRTEVTINGQTMGTTYEIKIRDIYPEKIDFLSYAIDSILLSINQSMSTYMQDSEISFINNDLKSFEPLELSKDFNYVLNKSLDYYVLTEGAFDVTVRPLLRLWGFRGGEVKNIPKTSDINNVMKYVGSDNIISMDASIIKKHSDLEIDFGAIAKGFGVDKTSQITVNFHKRRLEEDQDVFVREGDFILYGDIYYEITKLSQPRKLFGQVDQTFEISATCKRARKGLFDAT